MFPGPPFALIAACRLFHSPSIDELQEATEIETAHAGDPAAPGRPRGDGAVIDLQLGAAAPPDGGDVTSAS
ncbi:hypothetical protein Ga0609869_002032 [Rhodovulum iodosum]|uniref:Uncharacterized protein n=1 Tax=Rhodovulum iodosum TaxID=68291 RepID=A0ABV3XU19_9RHOB|nr:hypothetical protein [Rhodovulum robiginosum]RSK32125.1 hypothetical protein EJA01_12935 [Rhodovulum robiginosum]